MRVVVVGVGVMGLSAAAELAARGHEVDRCRPVRGRQHGWPRRAVPPGSSGWRTPPRQVRLAIWNHELWADLERAVGRPLRLHRGLLWRGGLVDEVAHALAAEGVEHEQVDQARQAELFPELRWAGELDLWSGSRTPERCAPMTPCGLASPGSVAVVGS